MQIQLYTTSLVFVLDGIPFNYFGVGNTPKEADDSALAFLENNFLRNKEHGPCWSITPDLFEAMHKKLERIKQVYTCLTSDAILDALYPFRENGSLTACKVLRFKTPLTIYEENILIDSDGKPID